MVFWALALAAGLGRAQEELLQELKNVARVEIRGAKHVGRGAIRKVIKTRGRSFWPWADRPVLRFDYLKSDVESIRQLYRHHGFLDTQVSYRVASARRGDEVDVEFEILEGPRSRIGRVAFAGVERYPLRDLRKRLWARPARPFDPAYLQLDTLLISTLYQEKGYRPHVEASAARGDPESTRVDVQYAVQEGERYRVGEVTISGHDRVRDRLITRELLLRPGNIYQRSRVERTSERLYETGLFSQVLIEPLPDSSHTVMNFDIRLRERKPRWIDAGVGSGTDERFRLSGEWGHRNVFGRGFQSALASRLTFYANGKFQRWNVQASLVEPWLLRSRTRAIITPYYERHDDRSSAAEDRSDTLGWVLSQDFKGVDFELRRELNRFARVTLTQKNLFANQRLTEVRSVPDSSVLDSLQRDYTTHRLVLGFDRDIRDNPFSPTRGTANRITAEVAGGPFQGTSSFSKVQGTSAWYTPLGNGWVLAARFGAGAIDPFGPRPVFSPGVDPEVNRVPTEDRFKTGGVNTIRGYNENEIPDPALGSGGLALVYGSLETRIPTPVRIPFLGTLGVEAYVDAGNVWSRPQYVRWSHFTSGDESDPNSVRVVAGLGPRVDLPVGPLRIDVTWRWRPTRSHAIVQFAIGPSF